MANIRKLVLIIIFLLILLLTLSMKYNQHIVNVNLNYPLYTSDSLKDLTIMTYNINHGQNIEGENNLDQVANLIKKNKIGIAAINEVDNRMARSGFKNQAAYLARKTDRNCVFAPAINKLTGSYGNALLSKYYIVKSSNIKLPSLNDNEPRGLLDTILLLPGQKKLRMLVTHLSLNNEERKLQIKWLENYIKDIEDPFFLAGDFNTNIESLGTLKPALAVKSYPAENPEIQIDYIFSNITANTITVKKTENEVSDHLPLIITMKDIKY